MFGLDIAILACLSGVSLFSIPVCPGIYIRFICLFFVVASSSLFWLIVAMTLGLKLFLTLFIVLSESLSMIYLV